MTEDKIFDEFNQLIKDLTDDLIRDTDDPYSDSVDTALTKVISARRSYKWKKPTIKESLTSKNRILMRIPEMQK